jgi:hypothetical protein
VQFLDVARCFPPQPEGGDFPWRDFAEGVEESTSAAPTASHIEKKKRKKALESGRVKDSDDFDSNNFSSKEDQLFMRICSTVILLSLGRIAFPTMASKIRKSNFQSKL